MGLMWIWLGCLLTVAVCMADDKRARIISKWGSRRRRSGGSVWLDLPKDGVKTALDTMITRANRDLGPVADNVDRLDLTNVNDILLYETGNCKYKAQTCVQKVQTQHYLQGLADIRYNFLVDENGQVYEGRGHQYVGEHSSSSEQDTQSLGIAFVGNFESEEPPQAAQDAVTSLIEDLCKINQGLPDGVSMSAAATGQAFRDMVTKCGGLLCSVRPSCVKVPTARDALLDTLNQLEKLLEADGDGLEADEDGAKQRELIDVLK